MIITAVVTTLDPRCEWQMELLEYSWREAGQSGELLRLAAASADQVPPQAHTARTIITIPWNPHPYTDDAYPGYDMAASLLEWLYSEPVDATVLVLEATSILLSPLTTEVEPGAALGNAWPAMPVGGSGPFGLDDAFVPLQRYCQNPGLALDPVQFPILVHSIDLKKIAPRWLELIGLIRSTVDSDHASDAVRLAYVIAAAEFRIKHEPATLGCSTHDSKVAGSVIDYAGQIRGGKKKTLWRSEDYRPWDRPTRKKPATKAGRHFLTWLDEYCSAREAGLHLRHLVPVRNADVRDARVVDQVILKVPGLKDDLSLNPSAAAIWNLIDNRRSLSAIAQTLEKQLGLKQGAIWQDVEAAAQHLKGNGAITIRVASGDRS